MRFGVLALIILSALFGCKKDNQIATSNYIDTIDTTNTIDTTDTIFDYRNTYVGKYLCNAFQFFRYDTLVDTIWTTTYSDTAFFTGDTLNITKADGSPKGYLLTFNPIAQYPYFVIAFISGFAVPAYPSVSTGSFHADSVSFTDFFPNSTVTTIKARYTIVSGVKL